MDEMGFALHGVPFGRLGGGGGVVGERMGPPQTYRGTFMALPWGASELPDAEDKDLSAKVALHQSTLGRMTRMNVPFPLTFRIFNEAREGTFTAASAPDFFDTLDESLIIMPHWMMQKLGIEPMDPIQVETVKLPPGNKVILQGHTSEYAQIEDIKEEMEHHMRNFPCLSRGDTIWLKYHGEPVSFTVLKVYSDQGSCESISCIDTDLKVVFERPLDCPPTPLENQPAHDHPWAKIGSLEGDGEDEVVVTSQSGFEYFCPLEPYMFQKEEDTLANLPAGFQAVDTRNVNLPSGFQFFSGQGRKLG